MKSGTQLEKSARPAIRMRPPTALSVEEGAKSLEKVDAWTEQPAREAAAMLALPAEQSLQALPAEKAKKEPPKMPWEDVTGTKPVTFRIPAALAAKLKYLGGVTYGESINSIAITAIEKEVRRMMKELNIDVAKGGV